MAAVMCEVFPVSRKKISDAESSLRTDGHFILLDWARWARCRAPNDWYTEEVTSRAIRGRGGGPTPTPPMPAHLIHVPAALSQLKHQQREVIRLNYIDMEAFSEILKLLDVSRSTHNTMLHEAQVAVAMWVRAKSQPLAELI